MPLLFDDEQHDEFGTWALAYIPYGGADFGEIAAVAAQVGDGDDSAFYQAWVDFADRLVDEADAAVAAGHTDSARELYLRASAYYASAVAALRRGYHCVLFDGPGQGEMLYSQGIPMRPDWESVLSPVVDVIAAQDIVDAESIVLSGWSFGGFLAPRAAPREWRPAAVIADPGASSNADSGSTA